MRRDAWPGREESYLPETDPDSPEPAVMRTEPLPEPEPSYADVDAPTNPYGTGGLLSSSPFLRVNTHCSLLLPLLLGIRSCSLRGKSLTGRVECVRGWVLFWVSASRPLARFSLSFPALMLASSRSSVSSAAPCPPCSPLSRSPSPAHSRAIFSANGRWPLRAPHPELLRSWMLEIDLDDWFAAALNDHQYDDPSFSDVEVDRAAGGGLDAFASRLESGVCVYFSVCVYVCVCVCVCVCVGAQDKDAAAQ